MLYCRRFLPPVAAIDRLSLVFVAVLALMFLGESFSWRVLFGLLFMVAGAILISIK